MATSTPRMLSGLLHVAGAFHQEASSDRAHIAASADDAGHTAQGTLVDERHHGVGRAAGHVSEQAKEQHRGDSQRSVAGMGKHQQTGTFAQHQHEQQRDAVIQVATGGKFVRHPAAQRACKQRQQAKAAGGHAGLRQRQFEVVDVVGGGDVVDEDLDAKAGAVGDEQQPYTVVGGGQLKTNPSRLSYPLRW